MRKEIGPIATPDAIPGARAPQDALGERDEEDLRKLAENPAIPMEDLGDISTLADPPIVASLKEGAMKLAGK